ncbi:MAG: SLC13 family permease [Candidatus Omnitrophica bacterium]|nr:SLC13 family permease [Candidatus Omnitrophota bacterium]
MLKKFIILVIIACGLGFLSREVGLDSHQAIAIAIFSGSILGTLFFWDFRLSFAFMGSALLFVTKTIDITHFITFCSLEVILFLVGMMVLVGLLKENGFFSLVTHLLLGIKHLTARKFVVILCAASWLMAASVDEVTSIIFMIAAILEVCNRLKVKPTPYVIISILTTNIGSAATVLGNPIGILIATKSGLTFEDFIAKALPLSAVCLVATTAICLVWYRKAFKEMDDEIKHLKNNEVTAMQKPYYITKDLRASLAIFAATLVIISLHHRLELFWGLESNTILFVAPLLASSLVFVWKRHSARKYVEKDVEWWTLLFFLFLFGQAGALRYTGATSILAKYLAEMTSSSINILTGCILWISAIGSSILDNVVLVATIIPVIQDFKGLGIGLQPLWWALLFGGCLGGNITLVGSTANIVALGILEKEKSLRVTFMQWFGVGLTVGIITTVIAWIAFLFVPFYR